MFDSEKPPWWFWPLWVVSGIVSIGIVGLVIWVLVEAGQWLARN